MPKTARIAWVALLGFTLCLYGCAVGGTAATPSVASPAASQPAVVSIDRPLNDAHCHYVNFVQDTEDDPDMLLHVLSAGEVYYLASDHTVGHHDNYQKNNWSGKVRFCKSLPPGKYQVTDIWNGTELGVFAPEQLAAGFDAGLYYNKQMKIFRIRRAP
jgi:hypothetical protein